MNLLLFSYLFCRINKDFNVKESLNKEVFRIEDLRIFYDSKKVIKNINVNIKSHKVTAVIGPSGCGKSTLLRQLNRMNDFISGFRAKGKIFYKGKNTLKSHYDVMFLRRQVGMVFQKPNPFPKSIYKNITWGPKINKILKNSDELVESTLQKVGLWEDVKDSLHDSALKLSGGQQQRLCIARAIALNPEVILMDEPCSALDIKATLKIEKLIQELKQFYTIIIVTHNMQQAARISDETHFYYKGKLIEADETKKIFSSPKEFKTKDYIEGRFG